MRSSKQRSRNKQNRNRSVGNVVNRVFDSSGPKGKVRGTPQQIIDKYNQLARDSQLSGDRVATENFQQHSEHYTRMLAEAQREQEAKREQQEAQHRERQQQQAEARAERPDRGQDRNADRGMGDQPQPDAQPRPERQPQSEVQAQPQAQPQSQPVEAAEKPADVIDVNEGADSGLVETPESKPAPKPRARRTRKPAAPKAAAPSTDEPGPAEAAE